MTSRPRIPPSLGRPRLPISMDDNFTGSRALPSPTSPTSPNSSLETRTSQPPLPSNQYQRIYRPRHHSQDHHHHDGGGDLPHDRSRPSLPHRHSHLPIPSVRPWENRHQTRHRQARSSTSQTRDDTMIPSTPMGDLQGWTSNMPTTGFWSPGTSYSHVPTPGPGAGSNVIVPLPPRSLSVTDLPRNPNGTKKQQSGRRRTACDRCKRQKSSVSSPRNKSICLS